MASDTRRDIKLDAITGDWDVSTGDLVILTGGDAIIQSAKLHLGFFQGEWFLDLDAGVPYWQRVMGKVKDPNILYPIFRAALLEPQGVVSVQSLVLTFDRSTRSLRVVFELLTDVGLLGPITQAVG